MKIVLSQILGIAKNTFLEAVRSKILHSVLLFGVFIVGISAIFGSVSIGDVSQVIKSFGYGTISIASVLCVIISGVSLFIKDISQKTIYNILSKPVDRSVYLLGKLLGLWFTGISLSFLMLLMLLVFLVPFEGRFDLLGFQALYFNSLELLIISSVTILFSALSVTPVLPGLFTFAVYLAGKSIYYLNYYTTSSEDHGSLVKLFSENLILRALVKLFNFILPDLHLLTPYDSLVYGISLSGQVLISALVYSTIYSAICYFFASYFFAKRDL